MNRDGKQHNGLGARRLARFVLPVLLWVLPGSLGAREGADPTRIERPDKIGVGTWPIHGKAQMRRDIDAMGARWFYTWRKRLHPADPRFVPMIWGRTRSAPRRVPLLLALNEPDEPKQAAMTVAHAIALWPRRMASAARLSSPATTRDGTLGAQSWLGRFMAEADRRSYRVDFIAVHYYTADPDVGTFKRFLEATHAQYGRPVWVTEWALADWTQPGRFAAADQQQFFENAVQMLDDLPFVERHAWFGSYAGLDGYDIGSALVDRRGGLTPLGATFRAAADGTLKGSPCPAWAQVGDGSGPPPTC